MRRVIGIDIHRIFGEVVFWEGGRLRPAGRVDMTRSALENFGRSLTKEDEVVVEATGNAMAVVRVLTPYVARVIVANPTQVNPSSTVASSKWLNRRDNLRRRGDVALHVGAA